MMNIIIDNSEVSIKLTIAEAYAMTKVLKLLLLEKGLSRIEELISFRGLLHQLLTNLLVAGCDKI